MTNDELADQICRQHERHYSRRPKEGLIQTCMIFHGDGQAELVQCPWRDKTERILVLEFLRQRVKEVSATKYAFWAEAWVSKGTLDKPLNEQLLPSQDPNREEMVFTIVVEPGQPVVTRAQRIRRDAITGKVLALIKEQPEAFPIMEGPLLDLLGDRSGTQH
jgi:hypothetical protein